MWKRIRKIKAVRKEHICMLCSFTIRIGEMAESIVGCNDDGDFYHYYTHSEYDQVCKELVRWERNAHWRHYI
jgi:hypothetical protein